MNRVYTLLVAGLILGAAEYAHAAEEGPVSTIATIITNDMSVYKTIYCAFVTFKGNTIYKKEPPILGFAIEPGKSKNDFTLVRNINEFRTEQLTTRFFVSDHDSFGAYLRGAEKLSDLEQFTKIYSVRIPNVNYCGIIKFTITSDNNQLNINMDKRDTKCQSFAEIKNNFEKRRKIK